MESSNARGSHTVAFYELERSGSSGKEGEGVVPDDAAALDDELPNIDVATSWHAGISKEHSAWHLCYQ